MRRGPEVTRLRILATATALVLVGGAAVAAGATGDVRAHRAAASSPVTPPRPAAGLDRAVRSAAPLPPVPAPARTALTASSAAPIAPLSPTPAKPATVPLVPPPSVAPLVAVRVPDLLIRGAHPLSTEQTAALQKIAGVKALSVIDSGRVHLGSQTVSAVGVDPTSLRSMTPRETASSDGLWASIARGDIASTYSLARSSHLALGAPLALAGKGRADSRLGAIAVFALPDADVVLDRATGHTLGLTPATTVLLAAPARSIAGLRADVLRVVPGAHVTELRPATVVASHPKTYRELYISSARYCPGLSWTVLAAIGQVESGHGVNVGPSSAGALGPMQFLPSTWATSGVDGDGDGKADILSAYDAVPAAALYLCQAGAAHGGKGLYDAIFSYNHADWYVREVLALAAAYK